MTTTSEGITNTIAKKYAKALFLSAEENKITETIKKELDILCEYLAEDYELNAVFSSARISRKDKERLVAKIFKKKFSELFCNFLRLLAIKQRIFQIFNIRKAYDFLLDEKKRISRGTLVTPYEILEIEKKNIEDFFSKKSGKKVLLEQKIDKTLISGIAVKFGYEIYDSSAKRQLNELKEIFLR